MDIGTPERESQVSKAFACLDKALDKLGAAIDVNNSRLTPLLRSETDADVAKDKEQLKRAEQVPLASKITDVEDRINRFREKLEDVQRRLEL